jgi:hypothetical protein
VSDPVKAERVEDVEWVCRKPGAFAFTESGSAMMFCCPCGCGEFGMLRIDNNRDRSRPQPPGSGPSWAWNGDRDRPTLTPSVFRMGGCGWHGFLTDGEWRSV